MCMQIQLDQYTALSIVSTKVGLGSSKLISQWIDNTNKNKMQGFKWKNSKELSGEEKELLYKRDTKRPHTHTHTHTQKQYKREVMGIVHRWLRIGV